MEEAGARGWLVADWGEAVTALPPKSCAYIALMSFCEVGGGWLAPEERLVDAESCEKDAAPCADASALT